MNVKNIKLEIKDLKSGLKEFADVLSKARKGIAVEKKDVLSFPNISALRKVLTEKRMELLHAVKKHTPKSIYELAKIVGRDLKSVNTDVSILADIGLMTLNVLKEERLKTQPKVDFDRINVEISI